MDFSKLSFIGMSWYCIIWWNLVILKQSLKCVGRYFDEISQDTGKYCFGVEDTLKAMEMGAVDILIVWENLDIQRFVLKNHSTDG